MASSSWQYELAHLLEALTKLIDAATDKIREGK